MDRSSSQQLEPGLERRVQLPIGALLCVINGRTAAPALGTPAVRATLRQLAVTAGVRRRFAPHQVRHAPAVEMAREGVPLNVIQGQLGHANFGATSVYLQSIDNSEIIDTVHARPAPMLPASAGLASVVARSGSRPEQRGLHRADGNSAGLRRGFSSGGNGAEAKRRSRDPPCGCSDGVRRGCRAARGSRGRNTPRPQPSRRSAGGLDCGLAGPRAERHSRLADATQRCGACRFQQKPGRGPL